MYRSHINHLNFIIMAKITLNVNNGIIDEYIEHVKYFNFFFAKRNESDTYRKKAMEHQKKMNQIRENLGLNVLMALEKFTGKYIPAEL